MKTAGLFLIAAALLLLGCTYQQTPSPTATATVTSTTGGSPLMTAALKTLASPGPEDTPPMQPEGSPTQQAGQLKEFSVTAKKFAFEPSTITVRKGDMVKLAITSVDVTHGFSLSGFNVNANIEPGRETVVEFTADKAGSFTFSCSVFCGEGHGGMKGQLVVEP